MKNLFINYTTYPHWFSYPQSLDFFKERTKGKMKDKKKVYKKTKEKRQRK